MLLDITLAYLKRNSITCLLMYLVWYDLFPNTCNCLTHRDGSITLIKQTRPSAATSWRQINIICMQYSCTQVKHMILSDFAILKPTCLKINIYIYKNKYLIYKGKSCSSSVCFVYSYTVWYIVDCVIVFQVTPKLSKKFNVHTRISCLMQLSSGQISDVSGLSPPSVLNNKKIQIQITWILLKR